MKTILEQFANGDLVMERPFSHKPEYKQALSAVVASREKLLALMNDTANNLFNEYLEATVILNHLEDIDSFVFGYTLGLRMTAEAFFRVT